MAYTIDKNDKDSDILIYGFEKGVANSPHKGLGNIQNANIATEEGEILVSYARTQNTMTSTSANGTLTFVDSTHVGLSIAGSNNKFKGMWVTVSGSTHTGELANGTYWVTLSTGGAFQLATTYGGSAISGYTSGLTATISLFRTMGKGIAYATESYFLSGTQYYRYYVLDSQGLVWVYDTVNDVFPNDDQQYWVLPDTDITYWGSDTAPTGLGFLNGWLIVMSGNKFWVKVSVKLGSSYVQMTNALMMGLKNTLNPHYGLVGHQGRMYYTDGTYVGAIFPNTSIEVNAIPNIQSYASWTGSSTTGTISNLYSGSVPSDGDINSTARIPAVFFTSAGGALPSSMTANVVYYIKYSLGNQNFEVYAAASGGSALDVATGASGTQYYDTFYPVGTHAGPNGDHTLMAFEPQRLNLPIFETGKFLNEIGNTVLVGCRSSAVYPWNQVDVTPSGLINLPEADTQYMLTVNQMAYIFAGYKGNIYITDGSTASLVLKLPDFCAGVPGTASSYIEPKYVWGGAGYIRGRVYFSVLDQTLIPQSSLQQKAGNCGGIWSFYPTQNIAVGQDTGLALRLENQNSYGTYNGYATLIIPRFDQTIGKGPQFFSAWQSSIVTADATYGIDTTSTSPASSYVFETDLIPVGTMLNKYTPKQIEYKMAAPLASGESVAMSWRKNGTDSYTSGGTAIKEGNTALSGYFNSNFQGAQWVQMKFTVTVATDSSSSWGRLNQIRMR